MNGNHKLNILEVADKIIRGVAFISLLPFALLIFFVGIMGAAHPNGGILPLLLILSAAGSVGLLIIYSSLSPEVMTKSLSKHPKTSFILGRIPAYIFAPIGFYFGGKFMINFIG